MSRGARSGNHERRNPIALRLPSNGEAHFKIRADPRRWIGGAAMSEYMAVARRASPGSQNQENIFKNKLTDMLIALGVSVI